MNCRVCHNLAINWFVVINWRSHVICTARMSRAIDNTSEFRYQQSCEANVAFTNCIRTYRDRSVSTKQFHIASKELKTANQEAKVHDGGQIVLESEMPQWKKCQVLKGHSCGTLTWLLLETASCMLQHSHPRVKPGLKGVAYFALEQRATNTHLFDSQCSSKYPVCIY